MSVVTAMEETGPSRIKLTIEVPAPAVEAEIGRVLQEYRKHIQLPGFRRGKVPTKVVQRRFKNEIEKEVVDRLLPRYWQQAQAEKSLDPLLPPQVEDLKIEPGEAMTIEVTVETRPEITLGDIHGFELPEESTDATETEVDDALTDLRRNFARWQSVDRPAAQGDLVVGEMRELGGETDADDEDDARPVHVEIGADGVPEELSLELTGKTPGATVEHVRTIEGADGEDSEEQRFEITVKEIKEEKLPELDDEFAKMVGDFETVDKLREVMTQQISSRKKGDLRNRRAQAMLQQLRDRHPLTLPEGVVQQESERILREQAENMARQGADLENAGIDWAAMAEQIRPAAERRVHDRLVLDAVAEVEDLRLDEERFERFLAAVAADQGTSSHALRQRLSEDGRIEGLRAQLLRDQTVAYLLGEEPESLGDEEAEDGEALDLAADDDTIGEATAGDEAAADATDDEDDPYADL